MRVMALATRLVVMRTDGVKRVLGPIVAAHAVRRRDRLIGAEAMAVLACGRVSSDMQRRRDGCVACRASGAAGGGAKLEVAVARGARELADVRRMARARAHEQVDRGDLLGHAIDAVAGTADRDRRDRDRAADHGREPIG